MTSGPPSERTRVRRLADRASYEQATVYAILDEALLVHVGVVTESGPVVLPMAFGRVGDTLYLHGAVGNALLKASGDAEVCVTATLLDGLVLARSAFHHSMNYRSVVVRGQARAVDGDEKLAALTAVVDHNLPGRWAAARPPSPSELRSTRVLALPLAEASAKVRTGPAVEDPDDLDLEVWAGVIPLSLVRAEPEPDSGCGQAAAPAW